MKYLIILLLVFFIQSCAKKEEALPPPPPSIPLHSVVNVTHYLENAKDEELALKFFQLLSTTNKNVLLVPEALNYSIGEPLPKSSSFTVNQKSFPKKFKSSEVNQWAETKVFNSDKVDPKYRPLHAIRYTLNYLWESPFSRALIKNEYFTVSRSETMQVRMMEQTGSFYYLEDENTRILELPLKGSLAIQFLLPRKGRDLNSVESKLSVEKIFPRAQPPHKETVLVKIPESNINSVVFFKQNLTDAGSGKRFVGQSEIAQIANVSLGHAGDLTISSEPKGSESSKSYSKEFICNQPFLFAIKKADKTIMLGKVLRPIED